MGTCKLLKSELIKNAVVFKSFPSKILWLTSVQSGFLLCLEYIGSTCALTNSSHRENAFGIFFYFNIGGKIKPLCVYLTELIHSNDPLSVYLTELFFLVLQLDVFFTQNIITNFLIFKKNRQLFPIAELWNYWMLKNAEKWHFRLKKVQKYTVSLFFSWKKYKNTFFHLFFHLA